MKCCVWGKLTRSQLPTGAVTPGVPCQSVYGRFLVLTARTGPIGNVPFGSRAVGYRAHCDRRNWADFALPEGVLERQELTLTGHCGSRTSGPRHAAHDYRRK